MPLLLLPYYFYVFICCNCRYHFSLFVPHTHIDQYMLLHCVDYKTKLNVCKMYNKFNIKCMIIKYSHKTEYTAQLYLNMHFTCKSYRLDSIKCEAEKHQCVANVVNIEIQQPIFQLSHSHNTQPCQNTNKIKKRIKSLEKWCKRGKKRRQRGNNKIGLYIFISIYC